MSNRIHLLAVFRNEEKNVNEFFDNAEGVFASVRITVCDSTDKTLELCTKRGAVVKPSKVRYLENNINELFATVPDGEWMLLLGADERLSDELKEDLKHLDESYNGYIVNVREYLFTGFAKYGRINAGPNYRLFRAGKVSFPIEPHGTPIVEGKVGELKGVLLHYHYKSWEDSVKRANSYSTDLRVEFEKAGCKNIDITERKPEARLLFGTHGFRRLHLFPTFQFFNYMIRHRFMWDGVNGWRVCSLVAKQAYNEEHIYQTTRK